MDWQRNCVKLNAKRVAGVVMVLLIVSGSLMTLLLSATPSSKRVRFNFSNWIIFVSDSAEFDRSGNRVRSGKIYHVGPLEISAEQENQRSPLGTNVAQVGTTLYNPRTGREIGKVLAVERWHEFDDGTERPGVLALDALIVADR